MGSFAGGGRWNVGTWRIPWIVLTSQPVGWWKLRTVWDALMASSVPNLWVPKAGHITTCEPCFLIPAVFLALCSVFVCFGMFLLCLFVVFLDYRQRSIVICGISPCLRWWWWMNTSQYLASCPIPAHQCGLRSASCHILMSLSMDLCLYQCTMRFPVHLYIIFAMMDAHIYLHTCNLTNWYSHAPPTHTHAYTII